MEGLRTEPFLLAWDDECSDQLLRTYADEQSVTERSAVAVSVMLALHTTNYTVIKRSRKGTGFDYMLGDSLDPLFTPKAKFDIKSNEI